MPLQNSEIRKMSLQSSNLRKYHFKLSLVLILQLQYICCTFFIKKKLYIKNTFVFPKIPQLRYIIEAIDEALVLYKERRL
jgi:hypothetical protein